MLLPMFVAAPLGIVYAAAFSVFGFRVGVTTDKVLVVSGIALVVAVSALLLYAVASQYNLKRSIRSSNV